MRHQWIFISCLAVALLAGCTASKSDPTPTSHYAPSQPYTEPEQRAANPGSLFDAADSQMLYADGRARRVGDIVIINIVETATGTNKAETSTDRESTIDLGVGSLFGSSKVSPLGPLGIGVLSGSTGTTPLVKAGSTSEFTGTGETKRENNVTATIAARVLRVHPGGILELEGARETRVNEETQYMVVTGLIRSRDIGPNNTILSTQMADAKIQYFGKGVVTDKQKPGWFIRLMDTIWPF